MSTNLVDKTTGELITLANGTRMWIGTQSAHDLAVQQGTMPNNCMVCITDESNSVLPDWSNAQAITISTTEWEAPSDGWIVGYALGASGNTTIISVNGVTISSSIFQSGDFAAFANIQVMVSKGDKIMSSLTLYSQTYHFVPFKKLGGA